VANEGLLLRMLEPIVRPDGAAGFHRPAQLPFEQQDFAQLLAQAQGEPPPTEGTDHAPARPLIGLAGVDRVQNADLLRLMDRQAG
jgi:hypothetical protein